MVPAPTKEKSAELFRGRPELLEGYRRGDSGVLAMVYELSVREVHRYLYAQLMRAGRADLAKSDVLADMLQEVFLRVFSKSARRAFRGPLFLPYANRVARNYLVDELRKRWREVPMAELPALATRESDSHGVEEDPGLLARLSRYVKGLPTPLREVYEHRFVRGATQEVARTHLGISRSTLRTREARLQRDLRREVLRAEVSDTSEAPGKFEGTVVESAALSGGSAGCR